MRSNPMAVGEIKLLGHNRAREAQLYEDIAISNDSGVVETTAHKFLWGSHLAVDHLGRQLGTQRATWPRNKPPSPRETFTLCCHTARVRRTRIREEPHVPTASDTLEIHMTS